MDHLFRFKPFKYDKLDRNNAINIFYTIFLIKYR